MITGCVSVARLPVILGGGGSLVAKYKDYCGINGDPGMWTGEVCDGRDEGTVVVA